MVKLYSQSNYQCEFRKIARIWLKALSEDEYRLAVAGRYSARSYISARGGDSKSRRCENPLSGESRHPKNVQAVGKSGMLMRESGRVGNCEREIYTVGK